MPELGRPIGRVDGQVVRVMPGLSAPWAVVYFDNGTEAITGQIAAVELADVPSVQIYDGATLYFIGKRYLYLFGFSYVEVVTPGEPNGLFIGFGNTGDPNMTLFEDEGYLTATVEGSLVIYCMATGEQRTACSNCTPQRNLGRPNGTQRLYLPDGDGGIFGAASPCRPDIANITLPRAPGAVAGFYADDDDNGVALCTDQGLFAIDTTSGTLQKVDSDPCKGVLGGRDSRVVYQTSDWLRSYDFSVGTVGNITTGGVTDVWEIGPNDVAVRRDSGLYVNGAGDGWVGRWRFMERGIDAHFTADGEGMTFLDHAATVNGAGLLIQAPLYGRMPPQNLARNVTRWDTLPDGRIVAASNHAFDGTQNRAVLVDIAHQQVRLLAESAVDIQRVPGRNEALIEKYGTTGGEHLLVRVAIPDYPY
jgi:hypothetical protein